MHINVKRCAIWLLYTTLYSFGNIKLSGKNHNGVEVMPPHPLWKTRADGLPSNSCFSPKAQNYLRMCSSGIYDLSFFIYLSIFLPAYGANTNEIL